MMTDSDTETTTTVPRARNNGRALRWDAIGQRWWWAHPDSGAIHWWQSPEPRPFRGMLPDPVHTLAHCASGRILLAMAKKLCLIDAPVGKATGKPPRLQCAVLCTIDAAEPRTIISDGRTDRSGRFVFGTANIAPDRRAIGSFFQYSPQHGVRRLALPTVVAARAICFSVDGATLYFADAAGGVIFQAAYDSALAAVTGVRPFAAAAPGLAVNDAVVDADGCVWSVQGGGAGGAALLRYGLDGSLNRVLDVHAATRSLAFGGSVLGDLVLLGADGGLRVAAVDGKGSVDLPFDDTTA